MDQQNYRILLIEAFDHHEVVERWLDAFHSVSIEIKVLPSPPAQQSWAQYLETASTQAALQEYDLIILNTVGRRPNWFAKALAGHNYWLVLHNLADWNGGPLALSSLKSWGSYTRECWHIRAKERLLSGARKVIVPLESMLPLAQKIAGNGRATWLPFACRGPAYDRSTKHRFKIVIPGKVTDQLKNYQEVYQALANYPTNGPALEVSLAGYLAEQKWATLLEQLQGPIQINSWPTGLSTTEFKQELSSADLVLAPLHQRRRRGPYRETTASTRTSGAVFDAIYFRKPLLTPTWHSRLGQDHYSYNSIEALATFIHDWATNGAPTANWDEFDQELWQKKWLEALAGY